MNPGASTTFEVSVRNTGLGLLGKQAVGAFARCFDAGAYTAADAQRIVNDAAAAKHMLATVESLAAARRELADLVAFLKAAR